MGVEEFKVGSIGKVLCSLCLKGWPPLDSCGRGAREGGAGEVRGGTLRGTQGGQGRDATFWRGFVQKGTSASVKSTNRKFISSTTSASALGHTNRNTRPHMHTTSRPLLENMMAENRVCHFIFLPPQKLELTVTSHSFYLHFSLLTGWIKFVLPSGYSSQALSQSNTEATGSSCHFLGKNKIKCLDTDAWTMTMQPKP